jgi:hypothetical protein
MLGAGKTFVRVARQLDKLGREGGKNVMTVEAIG